MSETPPIIAEAMARAPFHIRLHYDRAPAFDWRGFRMDRAADFERRARFRLGLFDTIQSRTLMRIERVRWGS